MPSETLLPWVECMGWADSVIPSYLEACNAQGPDDHRLALTLLLDTVALALYKIAGQDAAAFALFNAATNLDTAARAADHPTTTPGALQ